MFKFKCIIFILIILNSCKSNDTNNLIKENLNTINIENFDTFLAKFKTDTVFQKSRLRSPVLLETINEEASQESYTTSKLDQVIIPFSQNDWKEKVNFPINRISKDSIIVSIQGFDNGLLIEFYFINKNGLWYLNKIRDLSD